MDARSIQRALGAELGRQAMADSLKLIEAQREAMDAAFERPTKPLTGRELDRWIRQAREADILKTLEGER